MLGARWAPVPVATEEHTVVSRAVWGSEDMQGVARPGHILSSPSQPLRVDVLWDQHQGGGHSPHPSSSL